MPPIRADREGERPREPPAVDGCTGASILAPRCASGDTQTKTHGRRGWPGNWTRPAVADLTGTPGGRTLVLNGFPSGDPHGR